jgi:hypothetical protein
MRHLITLCLLALAACRVTPTPPGGRAEEERAAERRVEIGRDFELPVGESVIVAGGPRITFVAVASDSRCPSAVVCVWMGDAAVALRIAGGSETAEDTLHTAAGAGAQGGDWRGTVTRGGHTIELVGLQPYPVQGGDVEPGSYVATLRVTRP